MEEIKKSLDVSTTYDIERRYKDAFVQYLRTIDLITSSLMRYAIDSQAYNSIDLAPRLINFANLSLDRIKYLLDNHYAQFAASSPSPSTTPPPPMMLPPVPTSATATNTTTTSASASGTLSPPTTPFMSTATIYGYMQPQRSIQQQQQHTPSTAPPLYHQQPNHIFRSVTEPILPTFANTTTTTTAAAAASTTTSAALLNLPPTPTIPLYLPSSSSSSSSNAPPPAERRQYGRSQSFPVVPISSSDLTHLNNHNTSSSSSSNNNHNHNHNHNANNRHSLSYAMGNMNLNNNNNNNNNSNFNSNSNGGIVGATPRQLSILHKQEQRMGSLNAWSSFIGQRLDPQELHAMSLQFQRLDIRNGGFLDFEEFVAGMGILGKSPSNHFAQSLFHAFDTNHNGTVEESDFKVSMGILMKGTNEERLDLAMRIFDPHGKGVITKSYMTQLFNSIYKTLETMKLQVGYDPVMYVESLWAVLKQCALPMSPTTSQERMTRDEFRVAIQNPKCISLIKRLGLSNQCEWPDLSYQFDRNSLTPFFIGNSEFKQALNMMLGIQISAEMSSNNPTNIITMHDFSTEVKRNLPTAAPFHAPEFVSTFTDFAPLVFKRIRDFFGISEEEYMASLGITQMLGNLLLGKLTGLSGKVTDGKSGSFFFYSHDGRFLIKTIKHCEMNTLLHMLRKYYNHVTANPDTLLARFYGLHKIDDTPFVVMENIFETNEEIHLIYDLKGSTLGRTNAGGYIRKDLDFENECRIKLGPERRAIFLSQLEKDIKFLEANKILDYSLLVGIHYCSSREHEHKTLPAERSSPLPISYGNGFIQRKTPFWRREDGGMLSSSSSTSSSSCCGNNSGGGSDDLVVYFFGVIDILIDWSFKKTLEHDLKSMIHGDTHSISVVPPEEYSHRFLSFISSHVD